MAALKFSSLEVQAFDLDHLDVTWEIEDTAEDPERWEFYILRSIDGAGGPYEVIAGPLLHDGHFRDAEVNQLHNWRDYFYRMKAVSKDDAREIEVGPTYLEAPPDLFAIEFRRRFELMLQELNGRRVLVYPAITTGFRCRNCFDMGSNERGRSIGRQKIQNCGTCYDQTFVGGFGKPILSVMQIDPAPKEVQRTDTTERSMQDSTGRLSFFPPLKPKAMIVERENVRWTVERVATTQKLRSVVHQEPVLHRIPRSDIRYEVPVDFDSMREAGPPREFTRPMNLESAQCLESSEVGDLLDGLLSDTAGD